MREQFNTHILVVFQEMSVPLAAEIFLTTPRHEKHTHIITTPMFPSNPFISFPKAAAQRPRIHRTTEHKRKLRYECTVTRFSYVF